jgi:hypothetical protein
MPAVAFHACTAAAFCSMHLASRAMRIVGADRSVSSASPLGGSAMGFDGRGDVPRPFRAETVRGEPYEIGGRVLTPEARILSFAKGRGTVGRRGTSGWIFGFTRVSPLAVVEDTDAGSRRIDVVDATADALTALLAVALATTLLFTAVRWVARRARGRRT